MVYPKRPLPGRGDDGPKVRGFTSASGGGFSNKKIIGGVVVAVVLGGIIGFLVRPTHGDEADKAKADLKAAQAAGSAEKARADGLDKELTDLKAAKADSDKKLDDLSTKAADVDKKSAELDAAQKKIQGAIDKTTGTVTTEGQEIHLKLVDKVLFPTGEDQLTDKGKQVLDKVAAALKELPDKQIYVQGHTDDQPIYVTPKRPDPKTAKAPPGKGKTPVVAKTKPEDEPPDWVRFHTNWELSAARALEVVHYLQDKDKVDPSRLAAVAFGQYRPISRKDLAANRRIEIVLFPRKEILSK
jgi:chemotaxis protein MotB